MEIDEVRATMKEMFSLVQNILFTAFTGIFWRMKIFTRGSKTLFGYDEGLIKARHLARMSNEHYFLTQPIIFK